MLHFAFSYVLFPLLLLLDAAVDCRSVQKCDSAMPFVNQTPNKLSDAVGEGALQCLEELLTKCHLGSADQVCVSIITFKLYSYT